MQKTGAIVGAPRLALVLLASMAVLASCGSPSRPETVTAAAPASIAPAGETARVPHDPDDPAIWLHPTDPARSIIIGTDKIESRGGLYVYGVDGVLRQSIAPLDRPNNVDVEYGVTIGGRPADIAVITERMRHRLRVYAIGPDGALKDLAPEGLPVLAGEQGEASEPMGIAVYRRPADGAVFAIVAPKAGGEVGYLWQYRLDGDRRGRLSAALVRRFGRFSRAGETPDEVGEIEAIVVDDALGFVYYADERFGIRKYHADPDHPGAARELAVVGADGYLGDREGLAIYESGDGTGYLVSSDQIPNGTRVKLYRREGAPDNQHDHSEVWTIPTVADDTDGLEVTSRPLPGFPRGMLVMMHSRGQNFLLFDWRAIVAAPGGPEAAGATP